MIKVGSRDSRLAVVQAEEVMRRLGECELVTMKTTGDKILDRTLDKVGGKGLFVKELDRALAAGEVDLTVHSLKDVPMEQPDGLPLIAFPKRADARDALVLPEDGSWNVSGDCFQCQKCLEICPKKNAKSSIRNFRGNEIWFTLLRAVVLAAVLILAGI